ncbi:MAG: hypothetical protein BWX64_00297 [Acidobacteria bacterium ADurb.Bin051]|nr:MAG: hypothetical protein BWX64_00297 [Acidobacteria bacterium ADurb.Bin051]
MSSRERCEVVAPAHELVAIVDKLRGLGFRRDLGAPLRVGRYGFELVDEAAGLYRMVWWQRREPRRRRRPRAGGGE